MSDSAGPLSVECADLVVRYGKTTAVDHVSFDVAPGEIFGLLGPNAAGKTSVIRALTTIIPPAGGNVRIGGVALSDAQAVRARIGVLPESNGYPGAQTAREYLVFHGELGGLARGPARLRADELLDQLGLAQSARQRIGRFSRGMRQRLGICRALITHPAVLLLDEPTLGLDPAGKEEILAHLATKVRAAGTSVVLCSHLLDDVERICDRVAIMHRGRIVAAGTVHEVVGEAQLSGGVQVQVPASAVGAAEACLSGSPAVERVAVSETRVGELDVVLSSSGTPNDVAHLLVDGEIEIISFRQRGARLSDAFLKLTSDEAALA